MKKLRYQLRTAGALRYPETIGGLSRIYGVKPTTAVRIQVLVALIPYLLLRLAQLLFKGHRPIQVWARWVSVNLMQRRHCRYPGMIGGIPPSWLCQWVNRTVVEKYIERNPLVRPT